MLRITGETPRSDRQQLLRRAVPATLAWCIAIGALYFMRRTVAHPPAWLGLVAAASNLAALATGWAATARKIPAWVRDALPWWLVSASAALFFLVEITGGLRSPAVLVPGFVALGFAWRGSLANGATAAALWIAALVVAEPMFHRHVDPAWLFSLAVALFSIGLIPIAYARRAVAEEARARAKLARVEGYLADRRMTPLGNAVVSPDDLRSERQAQFQTAEGLRHIDALDRYLRDVRDTMGADEVVFWRFNEARQTQRAAAWSTEQATSPRYFDRDAWSPLVRWAAESGQVQCIADGDVSFFVVAEPMFHRHVDPAWLFSLAVALFSIGLIPIAYARRAVAEEARARAKLARVEGYLADRRMTPLGNAVVSPDDLRSERQAQFQTAEGLRHIDALDRYLRDVRDTMGADEVVFWRFNEARQTQRAAAWSTEQATSPRYFDRDAWSPLVRWAAESGQVQCIADGDVSFFVVAPVREGGRVHGALSISSRAGLTHTPDGAKRWAARHAAHAAVLLDLLDLRREASRHLLSTPALIRAAERLQAAKTTDALGAAICQTAIEVTSAQRSALIRWDPEHETGTVMAVSRGHTLQPGLAIDGDSVVAEQCSMRKLLHKEDARVLRGATIYGSGEPRREIGGLAVLPLARADIGVIGAIVIESDTHDTLTRREVENVSLLGVIAARSLETAWEIEEEWRKARTDGLTGLYNRRHFDEQLARIIADSLAHGSPASLIVADVDHFKRVNDTYGHEAGDAVLKAVARVFLDCLRAEDVCARYGGEEIAILLPETSVERAEEVAERVRKAIAAKPVQHGDRSIKVTASFGVAGYPESTALRDALFPAADRALYEAKDGGRNQVRTARGPAG